MAEDNKAHFFILLAISEMVYLLRRGETKLIFSSFVDAGVFLCSSQRSGPPFSSRWRPRSCSARANNRIFSKIGKNPILLGSKKPPVSSAAQKTQSSHRKCVLSTFIADRECVILTNLPDERSGGRTFLKHQFILQTYVKFGKNSEGEGGGEVKEVFAVVSVL